jgi:putative transposase
MTIPHRGWTSASTYFVTAGTFCKKNLLQSDRTAGLFCEVLMRYRSARKFALHAFVVMPNHIHLLITVPEGMTLERTVQFIKGGFSHEAGKIAKPIGPFWQKSFVDRRVRDLHEFEKYRDYIHQNPVCAGLVGTSEDYVYSSAAPSFVADELPQRLKPEIEESELMHR